MSSKTKPYERPSWNDHWLGIAKVVAKRSTCLRRRFGAVVVKNNVLLASGYNGAPKGLKHCSEVDCQRDRMGIPSGKNQEMCRGLHAEMNALLQAAEYGIPISGAILYSTTHPCSLCAKMIINTGIKRVVISDDYPDSQSKNLLEEADIEIIFCKKKKKKTEG